MKLIDQLRAKVNQVKAHSENKSNYDAQLKLTTLLSEMAILHACMGNKVEQQYENILLFEDIRTGSNYLIDFDNAEQLPSQMGYLTDATLQAFYRYRTRLENEAKGKIGGNKEQVLAKMIDYFYMQFRTDETMRFILTNPNGNLNKGKRLRNITFLNDSPQKLTVVSCYRNAKEMFFMFEEKYHARHITPKNLEKYIEHEFDYQCEKKYADRVNAR